MRFRTVPVLSLPILVTLALLASPLGQAQAPPGFGSQVTYGDPDFVPTLQDLTGTLVFGEDNDLDCVRHDAGTASDMTDDVIGISFDDTAGFQQYDLIVFSGVAFGGPAAGELVAGWHTLVGEGTDYETCEVGYVDVNENTRYDVGDWVYLTHTDFDAAGTAIPPTVAGADTTEPAWTVRLTGTDQFGAQTLVRTGDHDAADWTFADDFGDVAEIGVFDADLSASFRGGDDRLYIGFGGVADGDIPALASVRLFGDADESGTQVQFGDYDFIPTLQDLAGTLIFGADNALDCVRHDAGTASDMTDDVIGISFDDATGFQQYDLIVFSGSGYGGPAAGDLVSSGDTLLVGDGTDYETCEVGYVDANENMRYDVGDWVYLTYVDFDAPASAIPTTAAGADAATPPWTVRLTGTDQLGPQTLVRTGDHDVADWTFADDFADAAEIGVFDADLSASFRGGDDRLYIGTGGVTDGQVPALASVRLFGGAGDFGTQVMFGDEDFVPTLEDQSGTLIFGADNDLDCIRHDADTPGDSSDDVIGLSFDDTAGFQANDLVVASADFYGGPGAGDLVGIGDILLLGAGVDYEECEVVYVDANENGRYDAGDWVYLTSADIDVPGSNIPPTVGADTDVWTVRLTGTSGMAPATLVLEGDHDEVAWTVDDDFGAGGNVAEIGLFDADLDGAIESGDDCLYIAFNGVADGDLPPLGALRLSGPCSMPAIVPPPPPPPTGPAHLDVFPDAVVADGMDSAQVTVTLLDEDGNALGHARSDVEPVDLSAGDAHTCALMEDATVQCWGRDWFGQLGTGSFFFSQNTPAPVVGLAGVAAITTGEAHSCALVDDGSVHCWGAPWGGQLGRTTSAGENRVPGPVEGLGSATAVAAGGAHTCAILDDDTIRCWGANWDSQLGNNSLAENGAVESYTPVTVDDITTATAISAGDSHTCTILADETIRCWGANWYGQLGNSTIMDFTRTTPVTVDGITSATAVTVGDQFSCAIVNGGTVRCWGANWRGQLGNSTITDPTSTTPVTVDGITTATAITAGRDHACALLEDATIQCWGQNEYGQVGNGDAAEQAIPTEVEALAGASGVAAGGAHTCALSDDGAARCWGLNDGQQLGVVEDRYSAAPVDVLGPMVATGVSGGAQHTCAVLGAGTVHCWGENDEGQLGDGMMHFGRPEPAPVTGVTDAAAVATGGAHSCVLLDGGTIQCWGRNWDGQLGNTTIGLYGPMPTPVNVDNITGATAITAGSSHTCALLDDGTIQCWGNNYSGQLGNSSLAADEAEESFTPVSVDGIATATAVAAGGAHTCALLDDGTIQCWGANWYGQLGNSTVGAFTFESLSAIPVMVDGIQGATAITAGGDHTCALLGDGTIRCWGADWRGQLGNSTVSTTWINPGSATPVTVDDIDDVTAITAGDGHTCAIVDGGSVECWGGNFVGQLGSGTTFSGPVPAPVATLSGATDITAGGAHTCALLEDDTIKCWGSNWYGQLGDGVITGIHRTPAPPVEFQIHVTVDATHPGSVSWPVHMGYGEFRATLTCAGAGTTQVSAAVAGEAVPTEVPVTCTAPPSSTPPPSSGRPASSSVGGITLHPPEGPARVEATPGVTAGIHVALPDNAPAGATLTYQMQGGAVLPEARWSAAQGSLTFRAPTPEPGQTIVHTVLFRVTLDGQVSEALEVQVVTHREDLPPVVQVRATPQQAAPGETVVLDASASHDPEGQPLTFTWRQTDGPPVEMGGAAGPVLSFVAPDVPAGGEETLAFSVLASDGGLRTRSDPVEVLVAGSADPRDRLATTTAEAVQAVTVDASGPPAFVALPQGDGTILFRVEGDGEGTYEWDFGDGTTANGREVLHAYDDSGAFSVQLTRSDGAAGESATRDVAVHVPTATAEAGTPMWTILTLVAVGVVAIAVAGFLVVRATRR